MEYILTTNNLTKVYGDKRAADNVCLHIKKGEVYGLIGRNGAGKTTILKMIAGLSNPTSGDFSFCGKTGNEVLGIMNKIGSLIESPGLFPKMTAFQNIKLKCLSLGIKGNDCINELLKKVGLENTGKKPAQSFSLGMKQRLGIALALVGNPEFVILDEPINGLDPQGIAEMRDIIHSLSKDMGLTVIVSSHILDELAKIADSFGIINDGKLIDEFSKEQLAERCRQYIYLKVDKSDSAVKVLEKMNLQQFTKINDTDIKIISDVEDTSELVEALISKKIKVFEIAKKQGTLEEYYLTCTGGNQNA